MQKKYGVIMALIFSSILLSACGDSMTNIEKGASAGNNADADTEQDILALVSQNEDVWVDYVELLEAVVEKEKAEKAEKAEPGATIENPLQSFIDGNAMAYSAYFDKYFYITDLDMESGGWDSYSIGEMLDLDNDNEDELIINGPYGGMYIDAHGPDGAALVFEEGLGTSEQISYVYYRDAYWIVSSDVTHGGRQLRTFRKYDGANSVVDEFELNAEYWEQEHYDENSDFTYRGKKITMEQYEEIMDIIFGG